MLDYDVTVVGAGVAGSSLAFLLGRSGVRVLLAEKSYFPREKVCGEGLIPAAVGFLARMGWEREVMSEGAERFYGLRFFAAGESLSLDFSELSSDLYGLVLPRLRLDQFLAFQAARQPGVKLEEGMEVRSIQKETHRLRITGVREGRPLESTSRLVVVADGVRSRFHRLLQIRRRPCQPARFALRALFAGLLPNPTHVEVHCNPQGEAYLAPLGNGQVRVTLLLFANPGFARAGALEGRYREVLRGFPQLWPRLSTTVQVGPVESSAPLGLVVSRCHGHRFLLVGDAAGAVDPVTGQGMALALQDAHLAAEVVLERLERDRLQEGELAEYSQRRQAYFQPALSLAQGFLRILHRPRWTRRTLHLLRQSAPLRRKFLRLATELSPPKLSWIDRLRLWSGW